MTMNVACTHCGQNFAFDPGRPVPGGLRSPPGADGTAPEARLCYVPCTECGKRNEVGVDVEVPDRKA